MDASSPVFVLDKVDNLALPHEIAAGRFANDLSTLNVTWYGLEHLYETVKDAEAAYCAAPFGADPVASNKKLLARCVFDWYAVSSCNFVRLIGWMACQAGITQEKPADYVSRILPAITVHRHKIAAHYSRHSPDKDGDALQQASTMLFSLSVVNGRFFANHWRLAVRRNGIASDSSALIPWSLVEVHEQLRKRYIGQPA